MQWDADRLKRTWTSLAASMRSLDWSLIALILGFLLVVPIPGMTARPVTSPLLWTARLFTTDPFAAYENAVAAAAVKRPEYKRRLATIDSANTTVNVVRFQRSGELDRSRDIWVALGSQLHDACLGAADPVRKLQQILGLPPVAAGNNVVKELEVQRKDLFRPCVSSRDIGIGTPTCEFKLPDPPASEADAAGLRDAYDQLRFVTDQMWDSYRKGFRDDRRSPSDYPYTGFPFTGMGWTYNWGSSSGDPFGVSEFVVKRGAEIKVVGEKSPADFCKRS
jgi:hypothetical protein